VAEESHAAVVRSFYEAINDRDAAVIAHIADTVFAPDICLVIPPSLPYGGTVTGAAKLGAMFTRMLTAPSPVGAHSIVIADIVDGGDLVGARLRFDWFPPGSTDSVESGALELWRFEDDRVTEISAYYWDTAELVTATKRAQGVPTA
jgi:ketosteroid isomerase-like protein